MNQTIIEMSQTIAEQQAALLRCNALIMQLFGKFPEPERLAMATRFNETGSIDPPKAVKKATEQPPAAPTAPDAPTPLPTGPRRPARRTPRVVVAEERPAGSDEPPAA